MSLHDGGIAGKKIKQRLSQIKNKQCQKASQEQFWKQVLNLNLPNEKTSFLTFFENNTTNIKPKMVRTTFII